MLAGLPRLGMERGPPPGVAGEVNECSEAPRDSWLAGEPPLWLLSSASLPLLEQLLCMLGPLGGAFSGGMASPSSSKVVASISCSDLPARYICTLIHFFFRLQHKTGQVDHYRDF